MSCVLAVLFVLGLGLVAAGIVVAKKYARAQVAESRAARANEKESVRAAVNDERSSQSNQGGDVLAGVSYKNEKIESGPWSLHVVKVDRSRKDITYHAGLARGKVLGVSMIADQARALPKEIGKALAGVNGDFYLRDNPMYAGDPRGIQIVNGDFVSGPSTVCVWFDNEGNPRLDEVKGDLQVTWPGGKKTPFGLNEMRTSGTVVLYTPTYGPSTRVGGGRELILEKEGAGAWLPLEAGETYRAKIREISTNGNTRLTDGLMVLSVGPQLFSTLPEIAVGNVVEISTATTPSLKGVKTAIAGGPELIKDGKPFSHMTPPPGASRNYSERSKYERHPRSAIGWSATHFYLVTVDGRQPGLSVGMKLAELAAYMMKLGCTDAMNLDGGKSAQLWLNGKIVNSPAQGEDTVANSLLVVRKPSTQ